jgi:6-pyruvoyltetrahydropterin/6-carboxytetrahydropterin synthase
MLSVTKIITFEAAHCLPSHKGKCKNLHGHQFKLEVEIGNKHDVINDDGMIIDFGDIKEVLQQIVDDNLDHTYLNDFFAVPPTAENMVMWIVEQLQEKIGTSIRCSAYSYLTRVRIWETSNSYAEWRATA